MSEYRKKPVVIDAVQYVGKSDGYAQFSEGVPEWLSDALQTGRARIAQFRSCITLSTPEGTMVAEDGDWIIRGVMGEIYPCKPDIFAAIYERVNSTEGGQ